MRKSPLSADKLVGVSCVVCVPLWCCAVGCTAQFFQPVSSLQCHISHSHPHCRWTNCRCSLSRWVSRVL